MTTAVADRRLDVLKRDLDLVDRQLKIECLALF